MKNLLKLIFLHTPLLLFGLVYYGVKFVLKYPKEYKRLRLENKRILETLITPKQQAKQESKATNINTMLDTYIEQCIQKDGIDLVLENGVEVPLFMISSSLQKRVELDGLYRLDNSNGYRYNSLYGTIKIFIQNSGGFPS